MFSPSTNLYAQWRLRSGAAGKLREDGDSPPEHLLQAIWQHQRIQRDRLKTLDGQPVRVLHPGFVSREGGPDFRGAVLQIGETPPRSGDVEVDIRASGWHSHGHDRNPTFQNVLLHVVWEAERTTAKALPVLPLCNSLDAPLGELSLWLDGQSPDALPEKQRGKCSMSLRELSKSQLAKLLREAAAVRFQSKAVQFQARARHVGWEQALWEGMFRALGYKHNVWPMQCLAENRESWMRGADGVLMLQARMLGLSGLLPGELTRSRAAADTYLRRVWDLWWRERDRFGDFVLPRAAWTFHGLRPANHPQRRLALAAHWLAAGDLPAKLGRWCATNLTDNALLDSLFAVLQIERDEFWSWHWTFRSARLKRAQPLLGDKRVTDLAVNVILPWLWTRAAEGKNDKLQDEIERRYFAWPTAGDNAVLRLARQRLFDGTRDLPRGAAAQQGLMQITRDFCEHSNAVCEDCRFPEMITNRQI